MRNGHVAAGLAVLAILLAPGGAAAEENPNIVEFSITNGTPTTLRLGDTELTNALACWGDSSDPATEKCVDSPPTEIDPGDTATVYVTDFRELLQTTTGDARYIGSRDSGFSL